MGKINKEDKQDAIEILDVIDMYSNLDSIDSESRDNIIEYIVEKFNKKKMGEINCD